MKKPQYRHGRVFRCTICGKFISYNEINKNKIRVEHTPDTEFTVENTEFTHWSCKINN